MKRVFIINGKPRAVPSFFEETPQTGSLVVYNRITYEVSNVVYGSSSQEVGIVLNEASDEDN
ncbi:MAG: hypothetical protein LBM08_03995 [Dysgonamonadaceae bacterium]|jgi:hypothetical protein|nr:hypothetical protein [Dysgonamonadaceae bacterium]